MRRAWRALAVLALAGCAGPEPGAADPGAPAAAAQAAAPQPAEDGRGLYGTLEPFAEHAVYFVVTDRFVNGDRSNDQRDQGGAHPSFDRPLPECDGVSANVGYQGGDFRGLLDNAGYIREMGFGAVWITPIVENPDQAFTGGDPITCSSFLSDRGKAAYHGYWGMNFYRVDEHLPSEGLDFASFTDGMRAHGLRTVLDIVGNHASPAWSMPEAQPGYGQVFDARGRLVADHQNLPPERLDPERQPLHRFYATAPDLAQLGDFDPDNPEVMDYLVGAYLQWIEQGADAFRIDTIRHMPHGFWKRFTGRIRAVHPDFFMFAEAFDYEAAKIAPHTWAENGGVSVLDFPMKQAMDEVFAGGAGFERLAGALHLQDGPYANPYELATFYDNHDMPRMDATDAGFIDAHNWLFTARGIPVIYYGSETGFMRGRAEHAGNRNYFGQARIDAAAQSPIHAGLRHIANLRRVSPALQRGLQLGLRMEGDEAAFYRVFEQAGRAQIALVLLNKGDAPRRVEVRELLQPGQWRDGLGGETLTVEDRLAAEVPAHGVRVFLHDGPPRRADLRARLVELMARRLGGPEAPKAD
ncbi:alpha-amylase family glycosyl hydrolase [Luteimonas sp. RD2P54]|uniref:Alpha-amylase family glycosyl hydrolase n=1 Tax=Luteimonas endophytica TaxID=3042023 RepID=A0ABT6JB45_9GAMM|nr:alpha-amylase family glycosyl hydrolase [Luteimonas endophytica]MDH5823805.1 alpha-amylase family glycosyl hydrolase [Luteimonas endophytica]